MIIFLILFNNLTKKMQLFQISFFLKLKKIPKLFPLYRRILHSPYPPFFTTEKSPMLFNLKEGPNHADIDLSSVSLNLQSLNSFEEIKAKIDLNEFNFEKIYLRKEHLDLIKKCSQMKENITNESLKETKNFLEILKLINKNMHFLLLTKDHEETPLITEALMNNLFELQERLPQIFTQDPISPEYSFCLNVHFLRTILKAKNELWTHKILENLQNNENLQKDFLEIIDLLNFSDLIYLLKKVQKKQKKLENISEFLKTQICSMKRFEELSSFQDFNNLVVILQESIKEVKIEPKILITKFFSLLKTFENDWPLHKNSINAILSFLKRYLWDFTETGFLIDCIKSLEKSNSSEWDYDSFISFLSLIKSFSFFFSHQNMQKKQIYQSFIMEFYEKNQIFHSFQTTCFFIDLLNEKAFELKNLLNCLNIEKMIEFAEKTPDKNLANFFESLSIMTRRKIYELLFYEKPKNLQDYHLKINKSILLCYFLNPRDYDIFQFDIEELRKFKDNQFYLNKIHSFSLYLSKPFHDELLEYSLLNIEKSTKEEEFEEFLETIQSFVKCSDETSDFFRLKGQKMMNVQNRINAEMRDNSEIPTSTFQKIVSISGSSEIIKLSEKYLTKYIKKNLYNFSYSELTLSMLNLAISNQLYPEVNEILQHFFMRRFDFLNYKDLKNLMKVLGVSNSYLFNFHFIQGFYEVILSRGTLPEYAPLIAEYIFTQTKHEKKNQYALQTPINNLIFALKKSTYYMNLNKFAKVIRTFERIKMNFKQNLASDFRSLFSDQKLRSQINQIATRELAFIYTSIFSYAFIEIDSKEIVEKLHKLLSLEVSLDRIRNFDIGRIISELTVNFTNISDKPAMMSFLHEILLPKVLNKEFYLIEKTNQKDIGLFVLILWNLSVLQIPEITEQFISTFQSEINDLVKESICYQDKSPYPINSPAFAKEKQPKIRMSDMKRKFRNIHLMQIYQAFTLLSCYFDGKNPQLMKYLDEKLVLLRNVNSLKKNEKNRIKEEETLATESLFQEKVYFLLNQKIFQGKQKLELEKQLGPFYADICVEEPYNVIIECNGQQHYKAGKLKLNDLRKYEVFRKIYKKKVVELNSVEWNKLSAEEQIQYLKNSLEIKD